MKPTMHILVKIKGSGQRIEDFNNLIRWLDVDWPLGVGNSRAGATKVPTICKVCGGLVYTNPVLTKDQLAAAAVQCGVGFKVKQWRTEAECGRAVSC